MDILSNPMFTIVPFALWLALIAVALCTLDIDGKNPTALSKSPRDILDDHLTRHDIDREEYVDRRKGLDHMTAMV